MAAMLAASKLCPTGATLDGPTLLGAVSMGMAPSGSMSAGMRYAQPKGPTLLKAGARTGYAGAMVGAQHDAHLHEARRVLGQRALEPEQRDDVADAKVAFDQRAHGDAMVCRLLPAVVADGRHHVGRHAHLHALGNIILILLATASPVTRAACHYRKI